MKNGAFLFKCQTLSERCKTVQGPLLLYTFTLCTEAFPLRLTASVMLQMKCPGHKEATLSNGVKSYL